MKDRSVGCVESATCTYALLLNKQARCLNETPRRDVVGWCTVVAFQIVEVETSYWYYVSSIKKIWTPLVE